MIPIIWHNVQIHQEPPYPPRLQEETWRTGGVLTGFLMLDLEAASEGWSLTSDTNSRFIRNLHVFQHSMKLLGGQGESWWVSDVGCRWKSYVCMHAKHYTINMHFLDMKEGSSFQIWFLDRQTYANNFLCRCKVMIPSDPCLYCFEINTEEKTNILVVGFNCRYSRAGNSVWDAFKKTLKISLFVWS